MKETYQLAEMTQMFLYDGVRETKSEMTRSTTDIARACLEATTDEQPSDEEIWRSLTCKIFNRIYLEVCKCKKNTVEILTRKMAEENRPHTNRMSDFNKIYLLHLQYSVALLNSF